jgi:hypothetical protein
MHWKAPGVGPGGPSAAQYASSSHGGPSDGMGPHDAPIAALSVHTPHTSRLDGNHWSSVGP